MFHNIGYSTIETCNCAQENCTQVKRKRGSILDPDGLREGGPSKTYIPSKLKGVTIPKVEDWEKAAVTALRRYFGYQELKSFQRIAIEAWADNRDCFVLAATGSGKALVSLLISFVELILMFSTNISFSELHSLYVPLLDKTQKHSLPCL